MVTDTKTLYLELLKKTLSDYLNVDNPYANGVPPKFWWKKKGFKNLRNKWLVKLLRRSKIIVLRSDGLSTKERQEKREKGLDWPLMQAQTMIGIKRLNNIHELLEDVIDRGIEGDVIETGVWRGGASIFMRAVLKANVITDKKVWVCDSFEGLPIPEPDKYPWDKSDAHHTFNFLAVSKENVAANFEKYDLLDDQVCFVKGYFEDTLTQIPAENFCLIRLDGDMYSSTIVALEQLYPKLSSGGYIIIDDFNLGPCVEAVNDYRKANDITALITDVDGSGAYWCKD
jgi:O-methyltransferase